jgi:hypothetical protein
MVATDVASRGIGMISDSQRDPLSFLCLHSSVLFPVIFVIMRDPPYALLFRLVRSTCRYYYNLVQGMPYRPILH